MRCCCAALGALLAVLVGCGRMPASSAAAGEHLQASQPAQVTVNASTGEVGNHEFRGMDRNDYPGDDTMQQAHASFAFTGYWLTNPPGENANSWTGKRALLRSQGWGFLVLANGRLDAEILKAQKTGTAPAELGRRDAAVAVASARHEGFPAQTILFLDQEEGGRLLAEQAAYLLAWTEAVATSDFRAGVYASGQKVEDSPGVTIDTIEDIRTRVTTGKLHNVAMFDALDQCPPAPGCTLQVRSLKSLPDPDVIAWQYAQSPRRPEITKSCGASYAADGNCYAPGFPQMFLDMDVASSPDPSHGR